MSVFQIHTNSYNIIRESAAALESFWSIAMYEFRTYIVSCMAVRAFE